MSRIVIKGGNRLTGTIRVKGAKNSVLPILGASILCPGVSVIHDVPRLKDVEVMVRVLEHLGAKIDWRGDVLAIDAGNAKPVDGFDELTRQLRASNLVLGSLLGRFGRVRVSQPGGCNIGSRPMDLHIKGIKALGARVSERRGYISASAPILAGGIVHLDVPSVGATENIMMAGVLARGTTVIHNAAKEPEIVDLQNFLNRAGARIKGAGTGEIKIVGVKGLSPSEHFLIPDRIEAGTHLIAAAITRGDVTVTNVIPEHIEPVIAKLSEARVEVTVGDDQVRVRALERPKAVDIKTMPFPGFPTDMQPQMMALASLAGGTTVITETIFENRFKHVPELRRMGAKVHIEGQTAIVHGVSKLFGTQVQATDLRAAAALVLAGLAADNTTVVDDPGHLARGYEDLPGRYRALGADIVVEGD